MAEDNVVRKYEFHPALIGDIELGRPNLGFNVRVEVYRLMQYTFRDVIERKYGTEEADEIFFSAGRIAGTEFYRKYIGEQKDLGDFVRTLQGQLRENGIGILRVEKTSDDLGKLILSVEEDLDCSGLPELDFEVCKYDEGFLAGVMESYTGAPYNVREIDCWCTGDRTCRFTVDRA
ncbi:MAG: 4-vinyl reductase [Synergistaceae bacterium]|jgi:predicted hydrocarbon binding protein|nr:4-vinyl reductase [Synergistaceae bacterium]